MPFKNKEDLLRYQRKYQRKYQRETVYTNEAKRVKILSYKEKKYKADQKEEKAYRAFSGHIKLIYGAVRKFAIHPSRKIEICKESEFKAFSRDDLKYQELHAEWVLNKYDDDFAPVVSRIKYNEGYLIGNLFWGKKRQFGISKRQKSAISDLASVVAAIERAHAAKAQAPKSPEQEEKNQRIRRELREMKERQEERFRSIGRK